MNRQHSLCFVLANTKRARIVMQWRETLRPQILWTGDAEASRSVGDTLSLVGQGSRHPASFGWRVAKMLNEACARHSVSAVILIGPTRICSCIREGLDPSVISKIVAEVRKDLTLITGERLSRELRSIATKNS